MSSFVDFAELKTRVSLLDVVTMLGLKLRQSGNQWRGPCPACGAGDTRSLVITEGKGFFCFGAKKGGDQIALAAHVLNLPVKEAACHIATRSGTIPVQGTVHRNRTVPESERGEEPKKLQPLSYLEPEHDAVFAIGFDPEFCKQHGIGYAGKGIMRGTVAVPFRDDRGSLLGYIGITDARLPADFTPNVVTFNKKTA